ncbi:phage tail tube protein [Marinobacter nauticus]|uniref:phage tail tube protein n=1 Tax=Marinobacter nauticus TaxID=2743 RepID=UPI001C9A232D|nr:phage tail tube protein [Marinobacter nauticus]MBY5962119.1 hypothetical protein [Marinobacter nauticus]
MSDLKKIEVAYRPTGSADNFKYITYVTESLNTSNDTKESPNQRQNRQLSNTRIMSSEVSGSLDIAFAQDEYDSFLESALCSTFDVSGNLIIGEEKQSYDILKIYTYEDGTQDAVLFEGMHVNTLSLEIPEQDYVTGSIGFVGTHRTFNYDLTGLTIDPATKGEEYDASNQFGSIAINSGSIGVIKNISLSIDNGYQAVTGIDSQTPFKQKQGDIAVTGSIEVVMSKDAFALYKTSITNTPADIQYSLDNGSTSYAMSLPRVNLAGDLPSGNNTDVITMSLDMTGTFDATQGSVLKISKTTV